MPQPHQPAPLAPRPEPGVQLLEAVWQRHPERSLQLAQQWVHRRGIQDLQRFCSTHLSSALGAEAVTWLQELLALEAPSPTNGGAPASGPAGVEPGAPAPLSAKPAAEEKLSLVGSTSQADPEQVVGAGAATAEIRAASSLEPLDPPQAIQDREIVERELQARAVAAVDEAFAALAQTFQDENRSVEPAQAPQTALAAETAAARPLSPEPLPVRTGLWPSLRASAASLGLSLRTASGVAPISAADGEEASDPAAPARPEPQLSPAAISPEVAAAPVLLEQDAPSAAEAPAPLSGDPEADTSAVPPEAAAQLGLLQRLRGRIRTGRLPRLSRLRAVMRDCVEETVALLRTPEPERSDENGGFDASQPPEPLHAMEPLKPLEPAQPLKPLEPRQSAREQPSLSWTLDPFLPPSASPAAPPAASSSPAPEAAPGQQAPTPAAESVPAVPLPAPVSRPALNIPVNKQVGASDRPAPAPASLSDLRAWLPDRGDLPRAS